MADSPDFNNTEIAYKHLTNFQLRKSYWIFKSMNYNSLVKIGTFCIKLALRLRLPIRKIIEKTIFDIFCGGEDIEKSQKKMNILSQASIGTILDYSVEGEAHESSYNNTEKEIIETIAFAHKNATQIPYAVFKVSGIGSTELMTAKLEGGKMTDSELLELENIKSRFFSICKSAHNKKVRLLVDAEETWFQDFIDEIALEAMLAYNSDVCIIFNTYQMYRIQGLNNLKKHHEHLKSQNKKMGIKLVRGAYMEKERRKAEENGYTDPINPTKEATDQMFNEALKYCIENLDSIELCLGTHNELSNLLACEILAAKGLQNSDSRIYFAQLLGMCDAITYNLAEAKYNTAKYVPYGPINSVMPYLFRRAAENTSVKGQSSRELKKLSQEMKRRKLL
jgi:proline dehydrogenase